MAARGQSSAHACAGLSGGNSGAGDAAPDACVRIFELTAAGRFDEARPRSVSSPPRGSLTDSVSRPESRASDHRLRHGRSASTADAGFRVDCGGAAGSARQVRGGARMSLLIGALESAFAKQGRPVHA